MGEIGSSSSQDGWRPIHGHPSDVAMEAGVLERLPKCIVGFTSWLRLEVELWLDDHATTKPPPVTSLPRKRVFA
eukprot:5235551-Lingulodinium_polyedra.AAC.1